MIQNIAVSRIYPHPDNPRKDLGDLTELAESIKCNGIFQNLTIVPNHDSYDCDKGEFEEYIAVIGHRRLAASKLAGLTEVPCVISEMDHKTQVATMLTENMQRSDLTIWEQAQGFQMMLDFGETIEAISDQTGFSESTIRRRVKLLDLDKDKFKQSVERGATLQEYADLDKIQDVKTKNSVLEKIGTPDFRWTLKNAIDKETSEKHKALLIAELEKFATQVKTSDGMYSVRWFSNFSTEIKNIKPDDVGERKYFFVARQYDIELLAEAVKPEAETEAEAAIKEEQRQLQERRARLDEISKRAFQLRSDFVQNYKNAKKHNREIMAFAVHSMIQGGWNDFDSETFMEMMGIESSDDEDENEDLTFEQVSDLFVSSPERVLLIAAYCNYSDSVKKCYDWRCVFSRNQEFNDIYSFLEKIGYEMSEEEIALRDGTHNLYCNNEG